MKINKMNATFGKLKNASLELKPGLNVIHAPNEFGKSTWCAFIKAMFYGIDTSERDRASHLSDKTRYRPWDGSNMEGSMEFTFGGKDITVERSSLANAPMKNFKAFYTDTGEPVKDLTGENIGQAIIGAPEHVFTRTAFIRRPEMRVDKSSDLEKRIASIVSSGEETASYSEADSRLRSWLRKIRYNNSGTLPALEAELEENEEKLRTLERMSGKLADLRGSIERAETQVRLLTDDMEAHKKLNRRRAARRVIEARTRARVANENIEALESALTRNGRRITKDDIDLLRNASTSVEAIRSVREAALKTKWDAETAYADAHRARTASPLDGKDTARLDEDIKEARSLENTAATAKTRYIPLYAAIIMLVLGAAGAAAFSGLYKYILPALIASIVVFAAGLLGLLIRPGTKKAAEEKLKLLLSSYGAADADELEAEAEEYKALCRKDEEAKDARDAATLHLDESSRSAEELETRVRENVNTFLPGVDTHEKMLAALGEFEALLDRMTKARFEQISSTNIYETLLSEFEGDVDEEETFIPMPLRNFEDTEAALVKANSVLDDLTRNYNIAVGEYRALGDPAVIEGNIKSLSERINKETERYDALSLAIGALRESSTELQTRFSPLISHRASELMSCLTDGRYERLLFSSSFDAGAKTAEDTVSRGILSLSDGTADEIYLSLRLAMCELILSGDEPCPVILDDALVNFDNDRCTEALKLLISMADSRQVIMFTCHEREKLLLPEGAPVNIIEYC